MAVRWAQRQEAVLPGRVSFFGTSQGGGGALLMASLLRGRGARCVVADVPFLTHFPAGVRAPESGAYQLAANALAGLDDPEAGWFALGLVDTLSHAHRLDLPVMLTACERDRVCPPHTVTALFEKLPATRTFCFLADTSHCYTRESVALAASWFHLYA
jgi:cephalosporin-C deacetylase-like acetyl esterase